LIKLSLKSKILSMFGLIISISIGNFALLIYEENNTTNQQSWVLHTLNVITKSEEFLGHVRDAETGQRGYLLTGNANYLGLYSTDISKAKSSLNQIIKLTQDNPLQQSRLVIIEQLLSKKIGELDNTIHEYKGGNLEKSLAIVNSDYGKSIMDALRAHLNSFRGEENQLLKLRKLKFEDKKNGLQVLFFIGGLMIIATLVFVAYRLQRTLIDPILTLTESASRLAAGEKVKKITEVGRDELFLLARAFNNMQEKIETRLMKTEEDMLQRSHDLGERVKEQKGLYSLSEILNRPYISDNEILEAAVEIIPHAWHYPEITCGRISLNNRDYVTGNFRTTIWRQASDIFLQGERIGEIEVFYLEERSALDEGPFLKEERTLIDQLANRIGMWVQSKKIEKELQESEERYKDAVEGTSDLIAVINREGNITFVNHMSDKFFGVSAEVCVGMSAIEFIHPDDQTHTEKAFRGWIRNRENSAILENRQIGKDGTTHDISWNIKICYNDDGQFANLNATGRDITEQKILGNQLRQTQRMDAVGELTGGLAHDFNNVLGIIIGNLDLVKEKIEPGSKQKERIETAQNAALRGAELTRRLLNFARQSPQAHSPIDVNRILTNVKKLLAKSLTSKVAIELILADNLWMTELDPGDLEDSIVNLSLNARDAMPNGGRLIIETKNTVLEENTLKVKNGIEPGDFVEIAINDTGSGMSKEVSDRIFDPFFSTKKEGKGTGLGLAMVYGFVKRTKGHISVYSEEGIGTTFRIYLPRSLSASERIPKRSEEETVPNGTETILVVDDEQQLADVAEGILEELGYTTICANSGDDALRIINANDTIDLVFSDVVMPGSIGGFELAEAVSIKHPRLKVLLTSGFTGKIESSKASEVWINDLLIKPYRDIELAKRVRQVLDRGD